MAIRYTPQGGRQVFMDDVERGMAEAAMRGRMVQNQQAQILEGLRRQDLAAYSQAVAENARTQALIQQAMEDRASRESSMQSQLGLERERMGLQRDLASQDIDLRRQGMAAEGDRFGRGLEHQLVMAKLASEAGAAEQQRGWEHDANLMRMQQEFASGQANAQREHELSLREPTEYVREQDKRDRLLQALSMMSEANNPIVQQQAFSALMNILTEGGNAPWAQGGSGEGEGGGGQQTGVPTPDVMNMSPEKVLVDDDAFYATVSNIKSGYRPVESLRDLITRAQGKLGVTPERTYQLVLDALQRSILDDSREKTSSGEGVTGFLKDVLLNFSPTSRMPGRMSEITAWKKMPRMEEVMPLVTK